jgi:hypothetical protein
MRLRIIFNLIYALCHSKDEKIVLKKQEGDKYDTYDKYEQKADCTECNVFVGISWDLSG